MMTPNLILRWISSNKLLSFFGVATFCFLISTIALSAQNNALKRSMVLFKQKTSQQHIMAGAIPNPAESAESNRYRLPKHVKPTNYALKLYPNLSKKVFEGEVKISVSISKSVSTITLHAKDLDIHCVEVRSMNHTNISVASTTLLSTSEVLQVNLQEKIQANTSYELFLTFTGKLDKGIVGFYASTMRSGE